MRLVNDVLDLSRLEAQMMKFQIQVYDAVELCNEACYMARMKNETTGIQVRFYTETKSQPVRTDTARLTQMILSTLVYRMNTSKTKNRNASSVSYSAGKMKCFISKSLIRRWRILPLSHRKLSSGTKSTNYYWHISDEPIKSISNPRRVRKLFSPTRSLPIRNKALSLQNVNLNA